MLEKIQQKISQLPMDQLVQWLTALALELKATDIHFEAEEKQFKVRLRIDGILEQVAEIPKELFLPVVAQIKELAGLKISEHQSSQDGRFKIELPDQRSFDTRVSVIPSGYGESVIIRLLRPDIAMLSLNDLGLRSQLFKQVKEIIKSPNGILFVTGPTSSGKSTTLYAILSQLNKAGVKIFTIEDPIEYRLAGIIQTQVDRTAKYTFAAALRSLLRQNPNIIMLGEVRDKETAQAAIQASLTGHFVLTTLHTNRAVEAIQRLTSLQINPEEVTTAVRGIIAQRLVRCLCDHCKKPLTPSSSQADKLDQELKKIPNQYLTKEHQKSKLFQAVGCPRCHQRGYQGQIAIFEVLVTDQEIKKSILEDASANQLQELAENKDMLTLFQDGLLKALEGITTLEEVARATGQDLG